MTEKESAEVRKLNAEAELAELRAEGERIQLSRLETMGPESDTYLLYDVVNDGSVYDALGGLAQWSRRFPAQGLNIVIDSPGGSILDGLHLYDAIQHMRNEHYITTIGMGMAASMGGVLLQAGDLRVMSRNAFLLIHEASAGAAGKVSEIKDRAAFVARLQDKVAAILAERSTMSVEEIIERMDRRDWWMDAEEALELGFIDEIW